jgi:hypothetical protein
MITLRPKETDFDLYIQSSTNIFLIAGVSLFWWHAASFFEDRIDVVEWEKKLNR